MSKPRVLLVGWRLGGELERVIRQGRDRFDYTVVSMDLDESLRPLVDWRQMPRPGFGSFRFGWMTFFGLGGLRVARLEADLVHTVGPMPIVPNRVDLNTVTFCHAAYDEATSGNPIKGSSSSIGWRAGQRFTLGLERWWFRRAVRVLVGISEGSAADLRRFYPGVRVAVIPRGIDLRRFSPDDEDGRRFREERGVAADAVVAVFVDQQHRPLKGLDLAIAAFAAARRAGTGPTCSGSWAPGTRARPLWLPSSASGNAVQFLGYTSEVERCYRGADLFVLPTVYEAFCRAAHEAAACGLPVIAPPVNGIRELIGEDEAGVIARRDADDLARALRRAHGGPSAAAPGWERSRAGAPSCFDEDVVAERILALYESLLG